MSFFHSKLSNRQLNKVLTMAYQDLGCISSSLNLPPAYFISNPLAIFLSKLVLLHQDHGPRCSFCLESLFPPRNLFHSLPYLFESNLLTSWCCWIVLPASSHLPHFWVLHQDLAPSHVLHYWLVFVRLVWEYKLFERGDLCLFSYPCCIKPLRYWLAYSRHSINICWLNEKKIANILSFIEKIWHSVCQNTNEKLGLIFLQCNFFII